MIDKKDGAIRFALADCGRGFLRATRADGVPGIAIDREAMAWCIVDGNTSSRYSAQDEFAQRLPFDCLESPIPGPVKTDEDENHHEGIGLAKLAAVASEGGGIVEIVSGDARAVLKGREEPSFSTLAAPWRHEIARLIEDPGVDRTLVDLDGVKLVSEGFADEGVGVLVKFFGFEKVAERVRLLNAREDLAAGFSEAILVRARELAPEIDEMARKIGIQIFPHSWGDLGMRCSCPDSAVPCKHIAAIIYKFSQEIDANPFILFELRGLDIIGKLREKRLEFEQAQASEMPQWGDLLRSRGSSVPLKLSSLKSLAYSEIPDLGGSVIGLFKESPAGYMGKSLKAMVQKDMEKASKLAAAQQNDDEDRDNPVYDE